MSTRRSVAVVMGVAILAVLLRLAAIGDLTAPPLGSLGDLSAWADARTPAAAAVAVARFAAELAAWYLLALSALHALASVPGLAATGRLADALSTPGVARLVRSGLGAGLVVSTAVASAGGTEPASSATMRPAVEPGAGRATMVPLTPIESTDASDVDGTATMRPHQIIDVAEPDPISPTTIPAPASPTTWTVTAGESFWSIAGDVLEVELGRPPTDAEIDPRWRALIAANRHRLVDPDDPDLIVAGQVFELPAPD